MRTHRIVVTTLLFYGERSCVRWIKRNGFINKILNVLIEQTFIFTTNVGVEGVRHGISTEAVKGIADEYE